MSAFSSPSSKFPSSASLVGYEGGSGPSAGFLPLPAGGDDLWRPFDSDDLFTRDAELRRFVDPDECRHLFFSERGEHEAIFPADLTYEEYDAVYNKLARVSVLLDGADKFLHVSEIERAVLSAIGHRATTFRPAAPGGSPASTGTVVHVYIANQNGYKHLLPSGCVKCVVTLWTRGSFGRDCVRPLEALIDAGDSGALRVLGRTLAVIQVAAPPVLTAFVHGVQEYRALRRAGKAPAPSTATAATAAAAAKGGAWRQPLAMRALLDDDAGGADAATDAPPAATPAAPAALPPAAPPLHPPLRPAAVVSVAPSVPPPAAALDDDGDVDAAVNRHAKIAPAAAIAPLAALDLDESPTDDDAAPPAASPAAPTAAPPRCAARARQSRGPRTAAADAAQPAAFDLAAIAPAPVDARDGAVHLLDPRDTDARHHLERLTDALLVATTPAARAAAATLGPRRAARHPPPPTLTATCLAPLFARCLAHHAAAVAALRDALAASLVHFARRSVAEPLLLRGAALPPLPRPLFTVPAPLLRATQLSAAAAAAAAGGAAPRATHVAHAVLYADHRVLCVAAPAFRYRAAYPAAAAAAAAAASADDAACDGGGGGVQRFYGLCLAPHDHLEDAWALLLRARRRRALRRQRRALRLQRRLRRAASASGVLRRRSSDDGDAALDAAEEAALRATVDELLRRATPVLVKLYGDAPPAACDAGCAASGGGAAKAKPATATPVAVAAFASLTQETMARGVAGRPGVLEYLHVGKYAHPLPAVALAALPGGAAYAATVTHPATAAGAAGAAAGRQQRDVLVTALPVCSLRAVIDFVRAEHPLPGGSGAAVHEALFRIAKALCLALAALHVGEGLVHRDVRPETVVFLRDGSLRLADFCLARRCALPASQAAAAAMAAVASGAAFAASSLASSLAAALPPEWQYTAPEVLAPPAAAANAASAAASGATATAADAAQRFVIVTKAGDVYALGLVLYELLTHGERPSLPHLRRLHQPFFFVQHPDATGAAAATAGLSAAGGRHSGGGGDVNVLSMWPPLGQLYLALHHPWLLHALHHCLEADPAARPNVTQLLRHPVFVSFAANFDALLVRELNETLIRDYHATFDRAFAKRLRLLRPIESLLAFHALRNDRGGRGGGDEAAGAAAAAAAGDEDAAGLGGYFYRHHPAGRWVADMAAAQITSFITLGHEYTDLLPDLVHFPTPAAAAAAASAATAATAWATGSTCTEPS
eukprot:gene14793-10581_t